MSEWLCKTKKEKAMKFVLSEPVYVRNFTLIGIAIIMMLILF
jgi:hypothetical protein